MILALGGEGRRLPQVQEQSSLCGELSASQGDGDETLSPKRKVGHALSASTWEKEAGRSM